MEFLATAVVFIAMGATAIGWDVVFLAGLAKNTAQLMTLFALSNLWTARRRLLAMTP